MTNRRSGASTPNRTRITKAALLVAGTAVLGFLAACTTDNVTSPGSAYPTIANPALSRVGAEKPEKSVKTLKRDEDMRELTKSVWVDFRTGGKIEMKERGFKLEIPKGAVLTPTLIRVTALAGTDVAYEFEPHGTVFLKPLLFEQEIEGTKGKGKSNIEYQGGYFASRDQLRPGSSSFVNELLATNFDGKKATFDIWHFSGYLMSTGRTEPTDTIPEP